MHLVDSLGRCAELEPVCNYHEQACAIAAEAYARVTNGLGVALVTTGPGGTNTLTGVAGAWCDSTPCLFLSGQVKRATKLLIFGPKRIGARTTRTRHSGRAAAKRRHIASVIALSSE